MFGLSKFLEFTIYLQRSFYVEFVSEYYANNKPDVKIFGKRFSGYNILDFKFILYKYHLIDSLHLFPRLETSLFRT